MASEIHQDDIGTRFLITMKDDGELVDLSSPIASGLQVTFRKPSDTVIPRSGEILADGSAVSGIMYYDTVAGDLDEVGQYKMQAKVSLPSGTYYTDVHTFKVHSNL